MLNRRYPTLFSPLRVGSVTFRNRIVSAPTSLAELSPEGCLTRENIAYYQLKAKGGAAVVTVGESIVHSATGPFSRAPYVPQPPVPYRTFSETFSY